MAAQASEAVTHISQEIGALPKDQVAPELSGFLNAGYLSRIIAIEGVDSALQYTGAVEGAIGKVEEPEDRSTLGTEAAMSVANFLRTAKVFDRLGSFSEGVALVEQHIRFAELIESPAGRVTQLVSAADGALHLASHYNLPGTTYPLGLHAADCIDKAVAAAETMNDDPVTQASSLHHTAKAAARSVLLTANFVGDPSSETVVESEHQELTARLVARPVPIFEKALTAASTIGDRPRRLQKQGNIANSMAQSAAIVREVDPELSEELLNMAVAEIDDILAEYGTDPTRGAYVLVKLGSDLSRMIDESYKSPDQSSEQQRLIGKMVEVFKATDEYVQRATSPSGESDQYKGTDFSQAPLEAAERLLDVDFEHAKELYVVAYNLADARDRQIPSLGKRARVMNALQVQVQKQRTLKGAFELAALGYQSERSHLPVGEVSEDMRKIALYGLLYDRPAIEDDDERVALDKIDLSLVEFTLTTAGKVEGHDVSGSLLRRLTEFGRHLADPVLQERVTEQVETLRRRHEEARRPVGRIARIAYDNWPTDPDGPKIVD